MDILVKLRHAAVLALLGWFLSLYVGETYPKNCPECAIAGSIQTSFDSLPFKTKAECDKAGHNKVRAFYARAKKNGEKVTRPTSFRCVEKKEAN